MSHSLDEEILSLLSMSGETVDLLYDMLTDEDQRELGSAEDLTNLLHKLERRGLVRSSRAPNPSNPDETAIWWDLTVAGRSALSRDS